MDEIKADRRADEVAREDRRVVLEKYGNSLGRAFLSYSAEDFKIAEFPLHRRFFAEAVATALESDNHEQRVLGIEALLAATEEMMSIKNS
ncbi:hypothetical protein M1563_04260 [Patescibacteria group bacterium]|nr:hypothetical protein [Patescibacteria group bacterium]MCL5409561.1 hypothetical protein [Patescibacteria group bacterium]